MADESSSGSNDWIVPVVIFVMIWYVLNTLMSSPDPVEQMVVDDESGEMASTTEEEGGDTEAEGSDDRDVEDRPGGEEAIPDNWPDSVSIPTEANIGYVKVEKDHQKETEVLAVTFSIQESVAGISDYYNQVLVKNGWDVEIQTEIENGSVISAGHEDGKEVSVFITEVGQNEVSVTVSVVGVK